MTPDRLERLSSFLDGEPIQAAELAEALADPQAPEMLLDFVLLRAGLTDAQESPAARLDQRPRPSGHGWRWLAATAATVVLAVGGLWGVRQALSPRPRTERLPVAARVLHFENWNETTR